MSSDLNPPERDAVRTLQRRYVIALSLVALLSITAHVVTSHLIGAQRATGEVVNVAGRQRMLSQRIALLANQLATTVDPARRAELQAELDRATALFARSHEKLLEQGASRDQAPSPALREVYEGEPHHVDARVDTFLAHARAVAGTPAQPIESRASLDALTREALGPLLAGLNLAVDLRQREAESAVDRVLWIERAILALTLALLLAEGLFIFRPLVHRVRAALADALAALGEVRERESALRLVLDSTGDALVRVDLDGRVAPQWSSSVAAWFGAPSVGEAAAVRVFGESSTARVSFDLGLEQLRADLLPADVVLAQLPCTLARDGRRYAISYRLVDEPRGLLLVIRDETDAHERMIAEQQRRETHALLTHLIEGREAFESSCEELTEIAARVMSADTDPVVLCRDLHTLKGSAAILGLESLAERVHALETAVIEGEIARGAPELAEPAAHLQRALDGIAHLREKRPGGVVLSEHELRTFELELVARRDHAILHDEVSRWRWERVEPRLQRLAQHAERVAARLGRPIQVHVSAPGVRAHDQHLRPFWDSLVHVVRNAVDHGLESAEERREAGKSEVGTLRFEAALEAGRVRVRVSDDGRGIDWERLQDKARRLGLEVERPEDALFADGVSARDEVTEVSGRGVGMAAVRAACEAVGGSIHVESTRGHGTTFVFVLPTLAESLPPLRAAA